MTRLLKILGLFVAVASCVWVAVLWRWQVTQRDMSERDILLYLGALPLTLFALLLLGRWAWQGAAASARLREAPAGAPLDAPAGAASAPEAPDAGARAATLQLLAAHVHCAAGSGAATVCANIEAGQPRPALDPELRDDDGLPIMTARVGDLDPELPDLDPIEGTHRTRQAAWQHEHLRPEVRRALAALVSPVDASLAALQPWRACLGGDDAMQAPGVAPSLRVAALWPPCWTDFEVAVARCWLLGMLQRAAIAPASRVRVLDLPPRAGWPEVERVAHQLERDGRSDLVLVAACHSAIGLDSMRRLLAEGRVFSARTASMPMAGEGAAVLVLAPSSWPADPDGHTPPVHLHRAAVAVRDRSVDTRGRQATDAARRCVEEARASGPFAVEHLAAAVHDADQHTARAGEALTTLLEQLPHLQPAHDVLQTGALNGQTGVAAPLIVIALAAHRAHALQKPCLALSVDDAQQRLALVVRPAGFEPTLADTTAAAAAA